MKGKQNSDTNDYLNHFQRKMLEKAPGSPSKTVKFHMMFMLSMYYPNGKTEEKSVQRCWKYFCLGPLDVRQNEEFALPDLGQISSWCKFRNALGEVRRKQAHSPWTGFFCSTVCHICHSSFLHTSLYCDCRLWEGWR